MNNCNFPKQWKNSFLWFSWDSCCLGIPRWFSAKESACQCRRRRSHGFDPLVGKVSWRRKWQPTPIFLPGKFHGERSLASCSPWGRKGSDTTEHVPIHAHCLRKQLESESETRSVMSDSLQLYSPWNFSSQNIGVGSFSLLQGIFPAQGLNPGLPYCRQILY